MNDACGVVIGYDGSDHSMQALDWAMDEAEFRRLPLTICHAWQWPYRDGDQTARDSLHRAAEHVLWHGADCARASSGRLDVRPDAEAAMRGLPLLVIHAWHQPPVAWGGMTFPALDPLAVQKAAENWLAQALTSWREKAPKVTIEARMPQSRAGEALAAVTDATLVVVGSSHGRFGSVTAALLRHAPCPVAIVR